MTALDFDTILDLTPVADTKERFRIVWAKVGPAIYAHAYPVGRVNMRHHLCQGRYLSRLRDPSTRSGKFALPLYSPAQIKVFLEHQQRSVDPVCGCCYGVLYWLVGISANQTVDGYRLMRQAKRWAEMESR